MWVWHFEAYSTAEARNQLIEFCKGEKLSVIFVQVHYELDPTTQIPLAMRNPQAYGALIEQANQAGITVEALEGDPHWALKDQRETWWQKFKVIMDWYDRQPSQRRFSGLHLDVEPYLLDGFDTPEKWSILAQYVDYMNEVKIALQKRAPKLIFAADIPFWYDNILNADEYSNHCIVEFNGAKKPVSQHIQDICDYIGIMSYRQYALGENSITQLCQGELTYAEKIGRKIFPGVEMSPDQDPPTISFYGTNVALFREQVGLVEKTFGQRRGFGGVLVHYYNSYRDFLKSAPAE